MTRNRLTRICALALSITAMLAVSAQLAAAGSKANAQGLWVGGEKFFSEFQGNSLLTSGTPKPHLAFGSQDYNSPLSIVFDAHQNMWTVFSDPNGLPSAAIEISRGDIAALKAHKRAKPKVFIGPKTNTSTFPFQFAESIGLDAAGDLWVTDIGRRLIEFLSSQIKKSGGPAPSVVITPTDDTYIQKIKFDGSDNLWIVATPMPFNPSNPEQLWRLTPSDRAASGPANPSLVMSIPGQLTVIDFAFDSSGNLWIAGSGSPGDEIEMIAASHLSGTGVVSPLASATITSPAFAPNGEGDCLGGIDFDHSGDLWASVNSFSFGCVYGVVEFTPSQLTTGGSLTPSVTIGQNSTQTNLFISGPIRFGPTVK